MIKIAICETQNEAKVKEILQKADSGLTPFNFQTENEFYNTVTICEPSDLFIMDGRVLKELIAAKERDDKNIFLLPTGGGSAIIPISSIICIEHYNRRVTVYVEEGEPLRSRCIREDFITFIAPVLEDKKFTRARKYLVINMDKVVRVSGDSVELKNGMEVSIPKHIRGKIKKEWADYLR